MFGPIIIIIFDTVQQFILYWHANTTVTTEKSTDALWELPWSIANQSHVPFYNKLCGLTSAHSAA